MCGLCLFPPREGDAAGNEGSEGSVECDCGGWFVYPYACGWGSGVVREWAEAEDPLALIVPAVEAAVGPTARSCALSPLPRSPYEGPAARARAALLGRGLASPGREVGTREYALPVPICLMCDGEGASGGTPPK